MSRVAILISGGGSNMVTLAEDMAKAGHPGTPVAVISNKEDAGGLVKARALGIPAAVVDHKAYQDRAAFDAALAEKLAEFAPDVICLAGFMRILTPEFVSAHAGQILNIHPSLLPKYKGLNTHARALEAGDAEHGCSVHLVTPQLDDGQILGQARVPVLPQDTPQSLASRVLVQEHKLYPAVLRRFLSGGKEPIFLP